MRLLLLLLALLLPGFASAQVSRGVTQTVDPSYTNATDHPLRLDDIGQLYIRGNFSATPSSSSSLGIAPVVSSAAEANHVLKASAGNLYGVSVTTGAVAGYVLVSDATSAPADGAVTPKFCFILPASGSLGVVWNPPAVMATGITVSFSSTGCFTKTASATAFISGSVK